MTPMTELGLAPEDRDLVAGVVAGQRRALAKAITLVESTRADHQARAAAVLDALLPDALLHPGLRFHLQLAAPAGDGREAGAVVTRRALRAEAAQDDEEIVRDRALQPDASASLAPGPR